MNTINYLFETTRCLLFVTNRKYEKVETHNSVFKSNTLSNAFGAVRIDFRTRKGIGRFVGIVKFVSLRMHISIYKNISQTIFCYTVLDVGSQFGQLLLWNMTSYEQFNKRENPKKPTL